ncbi:MAG TPA: isoprenylcysteine carboxylmethyltransferase family protein [Longimicrobiales bacterium]
MSALAIIVCLGALALIGLLPRVFFRRGRLNARWWLTAAPFGVSAATLLLALAGAVAPFAGSLLASVGAIVLVVVAAAAIRWTLATHARPVSLWHQDDDRPDELVTRGAYARIRHPFYASFLLVLMACALALPHVFTIAALAAAALLLDRTAAREERRLTREFGERYIEYLKRTGRFVPRMPVRAVVVAATLAVAPTGASAQIGTPTLPEAKVEVPALPEQSLRNDVLVGASMGLMAGMGVALGLCVWDELSTVGLIRGDDEEDYQCDVEGPLLAAATGTAAGALLGLIVGAFGGDMPRGNFLEWSTRDPQQMPDDPKQSKIDDADYYEALAEERAEREEEW